MKKFPLLLQEFPWRNPIQLVNAISDLIQGKSICDIGCGAGDLMAYMLILGAKSVIGFEKNTKLITLAHQHERHYVKMADLWNTDLPECDIYYMWTDDRLMNEILPKIPKGKLVICGTSKFNPLNDNKLVQLLEKRSFDFDESTLCKERYQNWEYKGTRNIWICRRI